MFMDARQTGVLIRLMDADSPMTCADIGRESGLYPNGNVQTWADLGRSLIYPLTRLGVAAKCGRAPLRYEVTEKGRIAIALFRVIANRKTAHKEGVAA